jgi:FkbM family methyltransferase
MLIPFTLCNNIYASLHRSRITEILHGGAHLAEELSTYAENSIDKIVWAEPDISIHGTLSQRLATYPKPQLIIPFALWHETNTHDFHIASNRQSSSLLLPHEHLNEHPEITFSSIQKVRTVKYDDLHEQICSQLGGFSPEFVNLDIQGAELNALKGMETLLLSSVKMIYLEVNYIEIYHGNALKVEVDTWLLKYGFHPILSVKTPNQWGDTLYTKESVLTTN